MGKSLLEGKGDGHLSFPWKERDAPFKEERSCHTLPSQEGGAHPPSFRNPLQSIGNPLQVL